MAAWRRTEAREISAREEPPVQQAVTNDDWDMFGGAEFGGGSRSSCLGKSSTIDLPLFDHVTPLGIKKKLLFFGGGGKVAQLDKVPLASET